MDQMELCPRISAALKTARLKSFREVLCFSPGELQHLTGLSQTNIQELLAVAAAACRGSSPVPALRLRPGLCPAEAHRLSLACPVLDDWLRGGLPLQGLTELSGESGAGKTQLALQLCLSVQYPPEHGGLSSGAVYVCTEDAFPVRRLQQLVQEQRHLRPDVPPALISSLNFTDQIYVEHAADLGALQTCLARRVRLLLARGAVRLVVVDSAAALFRAEFRPDDWLERTRQLQGFAATLHHLSHEFMAPVLCINQVTDVLSGSDDSLGPVRSKAVPALGLAWANQVTVRLMMQRLPGALVQADQSSALRRLEVIFAPHLPRAGQDAAVWREGVRGIKH